MVKNSAFKALVVTLFFIVFYQFYNIEFIRKNVEDIGFDITNKLIFETFEQNTTTQNLMLFGVDDFYLRNKKLIDENNNTNYGYLFPRRYIAEFIQNLDELCNDLKDEHINMPKALFIDYDISFSSLVFGKKLSQDDKILINILKQNRPYTIFLVKNNDYNFIEQSDDNKIQKLIKEKKIIFVSAKFLKSNDQTTRRYTTYKIYKNKNIYKKYLNVNIALWQLITGNTIHNFKQNDIISNRIFLKSYKNKQNDDDCSISYSYWNNYIKYSANCLYEVDLDDFHDSIIYFGATYSKNNDEFEILNIGNNTEQIKGIELHANTLMSIFYINGQIKQLNIFQSAILIFFIYFIIDLFVGTLFLINILHNKDLYLLMVFILMTISMITLSIYLLITKKIWLNWFVNIVIFQIYDIIKYINLKYKQKFSKES